MSKKTIPVGEDAFRAATIGMSCIAQNLRRKRREQSREVLDGYAASLSEYCRMLNASHNVIVSTAVLEGSSGGRCTICKSEKVVSSWDTGRERYYVCADEQCQSMVRG